MKENNETTKSDDSSNALIANLAKLPILEYERRRKREACLLNCREPVLDELVAAQRENNRFEDLQGSALKLDNVELWHEPVGAVNVLGEIANVFKKYIVLSDEQADILALWCAHAHVFRAFICSPRLNICSPDKGCGKTTLRDVVALFVPRPLLTENLTLATLFRLVASQSPTILADEYDAWIKNDGELRGLLNAGHRYNGAAYRCEGDGNMVRQFAAFAPVVLCGIGRLPDTLQDRSIQIRLERAKPSEHPCRFDPRHANKERELCQKLARWCNDNFQKLAAADPTMPDAAYNRVADNWRPLFAIAELAGGDWPNRCENAFSKVTIKDHDDLASTAMMLLSDIQLVFTEYNDQRIFSKELLKLLWRMEDRPWRTMYYGNPINASWLARQLKRFGIHPKTLRIGTDQRSKGYEIASFAEVFERYLPRERQISRDNVTVSENGTVPTVTTTSYVTDSEPFQSPDDEGLSPRHASPEIIESNANGFFDDEMEEDRIVAMAVEEGLL